MKRFKYNIKDLDCANCAKKIEDELNKLGEIKNCVVNFGTSTLTFETNLEKPLDKVKEVVARVEPDCIIGEENKIEEDTKKKNHEVLRLVIGVIFAIIGFIGILGKNISTIFIIIAYLILLYRTILKAIKQLKGKIIDENTLIVISCVGAYLVGKQLEGLMVILLFEIGKILEGKAISKSRKSIKKLMNIKPEYANLIKEDGNSVKVQPEEVKIGDIIIVKQGEKVPLDGIVIKGDALLNTSALTGESKLSQVSKESKILSGSINVSGLIEIKVTEEYQNSTVSRILNLVEKATDRKAKMENFVSRAAKIYTPIIIIIAMLVAIFMPVVIKTVTYSQSIYKALIFLVIACPCSIAISVPLSYFSGIGKSSKRGILVKGSDYLDALKDINTIVFDKTGTITTGAFEVVKIQSLTEELNEEEVLKYFVLGESFSNHPIAKSILEKYKNEVDTSRIENVEEISGKGIKYEIDSKVIKIGNQKIIDEDNIEVKELGTIVYMTMDNILKGYIVLGDRVKYGIKHTIEKLNKFNIKTMIFTGDNKQIAEQVAKQVGINEVKAQMLPKDKFIELENIINNNDKIKKVAFVGDGINDSPVLARADVGISMGGIGASSAIEASDIVIMTDEIGKIIEGINISKKTNKIIKENLIFSIGVKILILVLSLCGMADMWEAVFADVGTTIITIFNTLRILK